MSILSGFFKTKRYRKTTDGYKLESNWTSGNTVELDDGNTVQNNLGAIKGITTSTSVKEEGYAADATTVAALNNSLSTVAYKDFGTISDCLVDTTNQGTYHFSSSSKNNPYTSGTGVIITSLISGNPSTGVLMSQRLAIGANGKLYTSIYRIGTTYGTWEEVGNSAITNLQTYVESIQSKNFSLQTTESNIKQGCKNTGFYFISGSETGHPLSGYNGYMFVVSNGISSVKTMFLNNGYSYIMSQNYSTGDIIADWKRLS